MKYLIIILLADPSIVVTGGTIMTPEGEIEVGPGTFVPAPHDKTLAKKIVEKNGEIEKLNTKLDSIENKYDSYRDYHKSRENMFQNEVRRLRAELGESSGWWSSWGSYVFTGITTAVVTFFVTREVYR